MVPVGQPVVDGSHPPEHPLDDRRYLGVLHAAPCLLKGQKRFPRRRVARLIGLAQRLEAKPVGIAIGLEDRGRVPGRLDVLTEQVVGHREANVQPRAVQVGIGLEHRRQEPAHAPREVAGRDGPLGLVEIPQTIEPQGRHLVESALVPPAPIVPVEDATALHRLHPAASKRDARAREGDGVARGRSRAGRGEGDRRRHENGPSPQGHQDHGAAIPSSCASRNLYPRGPP